MGLDCTHGAFNGAYSSFNRFRQAICASFGGSHPDHEDKSLDNGRWYWGKKDIEPEHEEALNFFFCHQDCEGDISPEMCKKVADALESLLPKLKPFEEKYGGGHIEATGGLIAVTQKFINGCRLAHKENETLEFW